MPVPVSIRMTKGRKAKNFAQGSVYVDDESTVEVVRKIGMACSPYSFYLFLTTMVGPYFEDQIVDTFAGLGGFGIPGGTWAPLQESTIRIRHQLGYYDDYAINERSGELVSWLANSRDTVVFGEGAMLNIPGDEGAGGELWHKLKVAQLGEVQGPGDMIPGAVTPPRPVLNMDEIDLIAVTKMLHIHIMNFIGKISAPIGSMG